MIELHVSKYRAVWFLVLNIRSQSYVRRTCLEEGGINILAFKNIGIQLHAHFLGHFLHLGLDLVFQSASQTEELAHFGKVEKQVAAQQSKPEEQMTTEVSYLLEQWQIGRIDKSPRSPETRQLKAIDRRTHVLVVSLDDAQIAADEDELSRPFSLVA